MTEVTIEKITEDEGESVFFLAQMDKATVGRAHLIINDDSAFLQDISVTELASGWAWFPPFHRRGVSYRGKGIGTRLLASVFESCKAAGVKELTGVMQGNLEFLTRWYSKNGFEILEDQKIRCYFSR